MDLVALDGLEQAARVLERGPVMVLSGAGLSTDSGIPDYRGPTGSARRGQPMTYDEFRHQDQARQRYWARSYLGWRAVSQATPNAGHIAIAQLERSGHLSGIVTQNVDGLHQAGGARSVIELHGNLATVICLDCGSRSTRAELDDRLRVVNPNWSGERAALRPDGDAVVAGDAIREFCVVACRECGGMLKPDVVFFGESVPKARVERCFELLGASAALLVVGSSLTVMSGYRFVLRAAREQIPVVIINQGPSRGDGQASVRVEAALGSALPHLVERLHAPTISSSSTALHEL